MKLTLQNFNSVSTESDAAELKSRVSWMDDLFSCLAFCLSNRFLMEQLTEDTTQAAASSCQEEN